MSANANDLRRISVIPTIVNKGQTKGYLWTFPNDLDPLGYEVVIYMDANNTAPLMTLTEGSGITSDAANKTIAIIFEDNLEVGKYIIEIKGITQASPHDHFYIGYYDVRSKYDALNGNC